MSTRTALACAGALTVALAAVGTGYSLFGGAEYVTPGNNSNRAVKLVSNTGNASTADDYSGIDFAVPANLTFADIQTLSTDYLFTDGSCGGGSPRFAITLENGQSAFVYIGPAPNYTGCPTGVWTNTGDLAEDASFVDTSQLGGTFYDTFANAWAQYGSLKVTSIVLVADGGWAMPSGNQTVLVDNVQINSSTYDFEFTSKDDCKNDGWKSFTYAPGPFKNQGQCVSYFATRK